MDPESDLKPIAVDPRAHFFFPNGTLFTIKISSRRLALIRMELDFFSMATSSMMIMKRKN